MDNVGRTLVKKTVLMLDSKDIDTIHNSVIYDIYKNLYMSKKEHEEKLIQGIQLVNVLKAWVGAKKCRRHSIDTDNAGKRV